MSILSFPFVRLAIALIAGRFLVDIWPDAPFVYLMQILVVLLLLTIGLRCCLRARKWQWHRMSIYLLLAQLSLVYALILQRPKQEVSLQEDYYCAVLLSAPIEKPKSYQCQVRPLSAMPEKEGFNLEKWLTKPGKWQLYLAKDSLAAQLQTGDVLYLRCRLSSVDEASVMTDYPDSLLAAYSRRPEAFDYHQFLRRQGYTATAYVPANQWHQEAHSNYFPLRRNMEQWRDMCVQRYEKAGLEGESLALISALTLGQKSLMEEGQRDKYSTIGVSHILAVSGMHVGIVCQLIMLLLCWMRGKPCWLVLRQILLILLLWAYAFLTALSASVLRAVIMYTVSALAICLRRKAYTWNSLAFAACVMLLCDVTYWYNVGFQLSFVAVMSILLLQPYFQKYFSLPESSTWQNMMTSSSMAAGDRSMTTRDRPMLAGAGRKVIGAFPRKIFDYFKEMFCLSLAAQIGTAPLSVYYFHQFSNYFWLSNLLLVPLALPLTYLGVFWQLLADVPWLNEVFSALLRLALRLFIDISNLLSQLPRMATYHLYPSLFEIIMLYVALFVVYYCCTSRKWHYYIENAFRRYRYRRQAFRGSVHM